MNSRTAMTNLSSLGRQLSVALILLIAAPAVGQPSGGSMQGILNNQTSSYPAIPMNNGGPKPMLSTMTAIETQGSQDWFSNFVVNKDLSLGLLYKMNFTFDFTMQEGKQERAGPGRSLPHHRGHVPQGRTLGRHPGTRAPERNLRRPLRHRQPAFDRQRPRRPRHHRDSAALCQPRRHRGGQYSLRRVHAVGVPDLQAVREDGRRGEHRHHQERPAYPQRIHAVSVDRTVGADGSPGQSQLSARTKNRRRIQTDPRREALPLGQPHSERP